MKAYRCRVCDNQLYFENSRCVSCGSNLGYARGERAIVPVDQKGQYVDSAGLVWHVCANLDLNGCTWLTELEGAQCFSCQLTRTRPQDSDLEGLANYRLAEQAKRHLIIELDTLGFTLTGKDPATGGDPDNGLAFDLLSSSEAAGGEHATIGHADGVITIDLAEADDAYRTQVKDKLAEPYRTMLGHVRHEVGHYIEWQLVTGDDLMSRCRELFGDESKDYQAEIDRHYQQGPPDDWEASYTRRCTPSRTSLRPGRTTCTSATPSRPPRSSASPRSPLSPPSRSSVTW